MTVRLLNPDVVDKHIATSADLAKAIDNSENKSAVLREEMVFRKVGN